MQRDAAARITGYTHTGAGASGLDRTFAYDNLNRLTAITQASSSTSYSYDATGNRTQKTVAGTGYSNTVSPTSNRLTQVSTPSGTASIGHDAAGNVTADGSATFSYSDRGRMASATTSAGTVNYLYDGRNQRVKKSGPSSLVNTGEAYYVYDEAGQLLGEYDASGNPVYETIYLGSIPVGAMKQAGSAANNDLTTSLYNIHADHIDTPRVITRQDHTIVWRWDTAEAFGSTAPNQNPSGLGTFVFNQRFPGQVFDQETGLNQNWNRDYDAWIGRYRQFDPLGLAAGVNGFAYAEQSPLAFSDPTGLDVELLIGGPYAGNAYGHVAMRIFGPGYDITYDYGRYGKTWGIGGSEGEGQMRTWTNFGKYMEGENATGRTTTGYTYTTTPEQDRAAMDYYSRLMSGVPANLSRPPFMEQKRIHDYDAANYNCTTVVLDGLANALPGGLVAALRNPRFNQGRGLSLMERGLYLGAQKGNGVTLPLDLQHAVQQTGGYRSTNTYRAKK